MKPKIYTEDTHAIDKNKIDRDALEILYKLKEHGHIAYLVGGGVRDLLLGLTPKDFDISTSAKPDEIKKIFQRRCLLIGKRFRLAHIRAGGKIFEVSTFRAGDPDTSALIVHDNLWGSPEEDVLRRDFTMNALYYDPTTHAVLDYVDGYQDLMTKTIHSIGDPVKRFKQDPVRMIRLFKFRARFSFAVDPKCSIALSKCKEEITKSAPARVLEEMFKMLESGASEPFFKLLFENGFLEILYPCFHHFIEGRHKGFAMKHLKACDAIHKTSKAPLDRNVLFSCLVFPILEQECQTLTEDRQVALRYSDILHLSNSLLRGITMSSFSHFPKKLIAVTHAICSMQFRLTPIGQDPKFLRKIGHHPDFQKALTLLRIRAKVRSELIDTYDKWKKEFGKKSNNMLIK